MNRIDKIISERFTSCHMSNAKWQKVFRILADENLGIKRVNWKFVDNDRIWNTSLPKEILLEEEYIAEVFSASFGPIAYKEIEWVEIPGQINLTNPKGDTQPQTTTQNIGKVVEALTRAGKFLVETSEDSVRVYGYS